MLLQVNANIIYVSRRYLWLCLMPSPARGIVMTATRSGNQATIYLGINMQDMAIDTEIDSNIPQ